MIQKFLIDACPAGEPPGMQVFTCVSLAGPGASTLQLGGSKGTFRAGQSVEPCSASLVSEPYATSLSCISEPELIAGYLPDATARRVYGKPPDKIASSKSP